MDCNPADAIQAFQMFCYNTSPIQKVLIATGRCSVESTLKMNYMDQAKLCEDDPYIKEKANLIQSGSERTWWGLLDHISRQRFVDAVVDRYLEKAKNDRLICEKFDKELEG